jgi:hypothetical protein
LLHPLSGLAKSCLLHTELTKLTGHRAKALGLLLANAKLLASQTADALTKLLELLALLAKDASGRLGCLVARLGLLHQQVGDVLVDGCFLARQCTALRSQVAVLLTSLQELTGSALTQLSLLHAEVAQLAASLHTQLSLLRAQLADALASLHLTLLLLLECVHGLRL